MASPAIYFLSLMVLFRTTASIAVVQLDEMCSKITEGKLSENARDCAFTADVLAGLQNVYEFGVDSDSKVEILVVRRDIWGSATMLLTAPDGTSTASVQRPYAEVIRVPASMSQATGVAKFKLAVTGNKLFNLYDLSIVLADASAFISDDQLPSLQALLSECCNESAQLGVCEMLTKSVRSARGVEDDICHQVASACDREGNLLQLDLSSTAVAGALACTSLPSTLSKLSSLNTLDLSDNALSGDMEVAATVVSSLSALRRLYLRGNGLWGALRCELLTPAIDVLDLSHNMLSGALPPCFLSSHTLQQLQLSSNQLTGDVPDIQLPAIPLSVLDLSSQAGGSSNFQGLSGQLPGTLNRATALRLLDFSHNSMEGQLPTLPNSLQVVNGTDNWLWGSLPSSLSQASALRQLSLAVNLVTGTMAPELLKLPLLQLLDLHSNNLQGQLPEIQDSLAPLAMVNLAGNMLAGNLPASLAHLPQLVSLDLSYNRFTGDLTNWVASLSINNIIASLSLQNNLLQGTVPPELLRLALFNGGMSRLQVLPHTPRQAGLWLNRNLFIGDFPTWLVSSLTTLDRPLPMVELGLGPTGSMPILACPMPNPELATTWASISSIFNFTCRSTNGTKVSVLTALSQPVPTSNFRTFSPSTTPLIENQPSLIIPPPPVSSFLPPTPLVVQNPVSPDQEVIEAESPPPEPVPEGKVGGASTMLVGVAVALSACGVLVVLTVTTLFVRRRMKRQASEGRRLQVQDYFMWSAMQDHDANRSANRLQYPTMPNASRSQGDFVYNYGSSVSSLPLPRR